MKLKPVVAGAAAYLLITFSLAVAWHIVPRSAADGVIDNESMRLDSTVVKSNIVSPSGSGLLDDAFEY